MLNKKDLAAVTQELNEQKGISLNKKDTEAFIDSVVEGIKELSKEDKLRIAGLGDFETVVKVARIGRNPSTGEPVDIPEKRVPKFKFAKGFKDFVK